MKEFVLAPSTFSFLYDECKRCFYDAVMKVRKRPMLPMPKIFTNIDIAMKERFEAGWHCLGPTLPRFRMISQNRRVRSHDIHVQGTDITLRIQGYYDSLVEFETGDHAVIDWKTSEVRADLATKYGRSLHAYAYCLEHPLYGEPRVIELLGLGVFAPEYFLSDVGQAQLTGTLQWIEIAKDGPSFAAFLQEVGNLLAGPQPRFNFACPYCAYRKAA